MKRRIFIPAFILMFCLIFSACQKEPACEHQFTTKTEKEASCQSGAVLKLNCQLCGITATQTTAPATTVSPNHSLRMLPVWIPASF